MEKKTPSVSIIIPTYNVENYIVECLQSVVAQTYKGDIECIIVDDCGTDNSIGKAQQFIDSYRGEILFRILHRERNGGLSAARNTGTQAATGDYIYYLDSDDYITPDCIEVMAHTAKMYPDADMVQAGIIGTNGLYIYDAKAVTSDDYQNNKTEIYAKLVLGKYPVSAWNKLLKRGFVIDNNLSFYEGVIHEDVDFVYKVAQNINAIAICRANTYVFRTKREGSITSTPANKDKSTYSRILIYNACLDNAEEPFRQIVARSVFVRLQGVLLGSDKETRLKLKSLCKRVVSMSTGFDTYIMYIYFSVNPFFQNKIYRLVHWWMARI